MRTKMNDTQYLPVEVRERQMRPHRFADMGRLPFGLAVSILQNNECDTEERARDLIVAYLDTLRVPEELAVIRYEAETDRYGRMSSYPVLPAWEDGDQFLHVWCCWCRDWHHHGKGQGTRTAHCDWASPWKDCGGYVLQRAGVYDRKTLALVPDTRFPYPAEPIRC